jgi:hypothetical protein
MQRITALDSIRGLLLAWMAIDHWGGPVSAQLYQRLGFWTAAEGFFFISGYVATQVALGKPDPQRWFLQRSRLVWKWHLVALLLMALLALALPALGWRPLQGLDGGGALRDVLGAAVLLHQPDYLDVLPLYVVLLLAAGAAVPELARRWPARAGYWVLSASLLLWLAAQCGALGVVRAPLPAWMRMGLFDPLGWQLLFFAGVSLALLRRDGRVLQPLLRRRLVVGATALALLFFGWRNGLAGMQPLPDESVWTSRAHLGPLRVLSFLAVAVLVAEVLRRWPRALDWSPTRFLGQHSLAVFSLHLPLVYLWHFRPAPGPWTAQVVVPLLMLGGLFLIARAHQRWTPVSASA